MLKEAVKGDEPRFNENDENSNFWMLIKIICGLVVIIIFLSICFWHGYKKIQLEKQTMLKKLEHFSGLTFNCF